MKKSLLFALVMLISAMSAYAESTIFQIGVWAPKYQIAPEETDISGLKINLPYGGNNVIQGLDIGFASTSKTTSAAQLNFIINRAHESFSGIQLALINQSGDTCGLSLGLLNITEYKTRGIQFGALNSTMDMAGAQLGLVNYTESMTGIQIGFVNIITESVLPVFPFFNCCF